MKRLLFVIALSATILTKGFGQLFPTCSYPSSVDLFGLCEVSFRIPWTYSNPYNPDTINVYAVFTGPDNSSYTVNAFYYEDYTFQQDTNDGHELASHNPANDGWRVRFTPTVLGTWNFYIRAFDKNGELNLSSLNGNHTFSCTAVSKANGFITLANSRYLKRDIIKGGQRQIHSYYPIGPNVAWYSYLDYGSYTQPIGIYDYKRRIDSLAGNANYMRVFVNRFQSLSLFGPEYTQTVNSEPLVYFDSIINQKDSAELDYIITYALQHGISIMPSVFNHTVFKYTNPDPLDVSIWEYNPFRYKLNLSSPCEFFTDYDAKRITKNLLRYIVARWGYATNILGWELWNEVDNMFGSCVGYSQSEIEEDVQDWHEEMADYLYSIDPFHHCVSTSIGDVYEHPDLYLVLYDNLDFVQEHRYESIRNAESRHQLLFRIYEKTMNAHVLYPSKPFFTGEFGFGQNKDTQKYADKDPYGIDLHNTLWSSLFFTSIGPASFWWWNYVDECGLYHHYTPLLTFSQSLPILSESFTSHHTGNIVGHKLVFPNNLQTYYIINEPQDTICGWSQDTAFAYQSLRWLTDSVNLDSTIWGPVLRFKANGVYDSLGYVYTLDPLKRPAPSSNSNVITLPITNQPVGTTYQLQWYNSETGFPFNMVVINIPVQQNQQGNKFLSFQFPSSIRDLKNHTINNTFGDAVFVLTKRYQDPFKQQ